MKVINIVVIMAICMFCSASVFAENITPEILLEKYKTNKNAFEKQIIKSEELVERISTLYDEPEFDVYEYECRKMDGKLDFIHKKLRDVELDEKGSVLSSKQPDEKRVIWDGQEWSEVSLRDRVIAYFSSSEKQKNQALASVYGGNYLDGSLWGDKRSIDVILKESSEISLRSEMEKVNEIDCYVIDAITPNGKYTLWFDPEHGYNIAKAKSYKSGNDLYFAEPVSQEIKKQAGTRVATKEPGKIIDVLFLLEIAEFQKVNDIWVPIESESEITTKYDDRTTIYKKTLKRTHVDLDPDFEAVNAFKPDIPEGTKVVYENSPGINYIWQNGKVVPVMDEGILKVITNEMLSLSDDSILSTNNNEIIDTNQMINKETYISNDELVLTNNEPVKITKKVALKISPTIKIIIFMSILTIVGVSYIIFRHIRKES